MAKDAAELHIYAQEQWHDEAYVMGDREGLTALRDTLTKALEEGTAESTDLFVADGEGFRVCVACIDDENTMERLACPYTEEMAREHRENIIWPAQLYYRLKG